MTAAVITAAACLTPAGHDPDRLLAALRGPMAGIRPVASREGRAPDVLAGIIDSPEGLDKRYVPAGLRRRMNRLSLLSCAAVGQVLDQAGLCAGERGETGLILATAFGGTSQCARFFGGLLTEGDRLVNPALFPETVPSAPSGQAGLCFGLGGPSTTVCQQSLSSEYALLIARQMLGSGLAERLVVLAVEEMGPPLLEGLAALGLVKRPDEMTPEGIRLSPRGVPGEAAVALLLETARAARDRGASPLAELVGVAAGGAALASARFGRIGHNTAELTQCACQAHGLPDLVVAAGTFLEKADTGQWQALARVLGPETAVTVPEYATGHLCGAGLLRTVLAAWAVSGRDIPCASLGAPLPRVIAPAGLFSRTARRSRLAMTHAATPGGGAAVVCLRGVGEGVGL
jgi:3-oxoacyl-[acyl-carrier-protein] synthase II